MNPSLSDIAQLIVNHIRGTIDENQQKILNDWLQDTNRKKLFNQIIQKKKILRSAERYDTYDIEKAWNKLEKEMSKPKRRNSWLKYAAAIVLPLAISWFVITQIQHSAQTVAEADTLQPGESNAVLFLADGKVIDLKNDTSGTIKLDNKLLLAREANKIKINSSKMMESELISMNKIVTPVGGEYQIELPDGTNVWLNADSYLEFPSRFTGKERKVIAHGELYFDVAKDLEKPFVVKSQELTLEVLGTEFNLRSYKDEGNIVSTLVEGSLNVSNGSGDELLLSPGFQAELNKTDNQLSEEVANIEEVIAWKEGKFTFESKALCDILRDLSRWYDAELIYENETVKQETFSVDVPRYNDISGVLDLIEATDEVKFEIEEKKIIIK